MLFYVKKYLFLDILVTCSLAGFAIAGIRYYNLSPDFSVTPRILTYGIVALVAVTGWTFLVQAGYALVKGKEYAEQLTASLAKEYASASLLQAVFGGIAAAFGEELFFRGFIQTRFGILAGTILFGLAHLGKKDIRVVSFWAYPQGLLFGIAYTLTGHVAVSMIAHGLFDIGGVLYFRRLMKRA